MTIQSYQEEVDEWIKTIGVRYFDEKTNSIILMEEMGEFSRLMARIYGEQSFKNKKDKKEAKAKIKDELADMLFVITCLANQMDIDLTSSIRDNFDKKTNRDKTRHKKNKKLKEQKLKL